MTTGDGIVALGLILGALQVASTAYLRYLTNKNACGALKCVRTIKELSGREESQP